MRRGIDAIYYIGRNGERFYITEEEFVAFASQRDAINGRSLVDEARNQGILDEEWAK